MKTKLDQEFLGSQIGLGNVVMVDGAAYSKGTEQYKSTVSVPVSTFTEEQMASVRGNDTPEYMKAIDGILAGSISLPPNVPMEGILEIKNCILASRVGQPVKHYINGRLVGTPPTPPALNARYINGVWYGKHDLRGNFNKLSKTQKTIFWIILVLLSPVIIYLAPWIFAIILGIAMMILIIFGMIKDAIFSWINGLSSNPIGGKKH
jgi:hypothetical protein